MYLNFLRRKLPGLAAQARDPHPCPRLPRGATLGRRLPRTCKTVTRTVSRWVALSGTSDTTPAAAAGRTLMPSLAIVREPLARVSRTDPSRTGAHASPA